MEWIGYSAFIVQLGKQTIKESNVAQKQQVVLKALHNLSKQGHQFTVRMPIFWLNASHDITRPLCEQLSLPFSILVLLFQKWFLTFIVPKIYQSSWITKPEPKYIFSRMDIILLAKRQWWYSSFQSVAVEMGFSPNRMIQIRLTTLRTTDLF